MHAKVMCENVEILFAISLFRESFLIHTLLDINECASNGGLGLCEQICTNTVGSYYCSCLLGYTVSTNGTSCDGELIQLPTASKSSKT